MFTSARLKLTAWYLLIILIITGTLSGLFYFRTSLVLEQEFRRIEQRMLREGIFTPSKSIQLQLFAEDLVLAKRQILLQIVFLNSLIALFFGIAGFILSGKTLRPIQEAMDEQKRFIGDAAHELKTPITAMKTALEVNLMDDNLPKVVRKLCQENLEDVVHLEKLTSRLLQLSRVQDRSLNFEMLDLAEVARKAVKQITPLAKKNQIEIVFHQTPDKPVELEADRSSLIELCLIFLDNAIKYSHKGGKIELQVCSKRSYVYIEIADNGVGIARKHLPHIFDRFYRVDQSRAKYDTGGYGLGLSLAQKIIDQHNGSINVKSVVNKGTTFTVTLPKFQSSS